MAGREGDEKLVQILVPFAPDPFTAARRSQILNYHNSMSSGRNLFT
jgi:hypothetical protein